MTRTSTIDLKKFARSVLVAAKTDPEDAGILIDNLIWNDLVGRANHGVERLPIMVRRLQSGLIRSPATMKFTEIAEGIATLDADEGFGQVAGARATDRAIEYARTKGVGIVGVRNSNFYGSGAYFIHRAAAAGMVSLVLSNSFPKVAAHGGRQPVMGTNPFAFGAPRGNGQTFMVDMSTAGIAGSTIRSHISKGLDLPGGLMIDERGKSITDPKLSSMGTLLPASGAKGFGLAMMVEILAGVLTGSGMSHQVGSMYKDFNRPGNSGHFIMTLDISRWMSPEVYFARFETLAEMIGVLDDANDVRLPGEARWQAMSENTKYGIALEPETADRLRELAVVLGIKAPF